VTFAVLLELFRGFSTPELFRTPTAPAIASVIQALPTDPTAYTAAAAEAVAVLLEQPSAPDQEGFQEFGDLLRVLLYYDGRTLEACLQVADTACVSPKAEDAGVNALAAIANYLRSGGAVRLSVKEFTERLERYMENSALFHNARECRNLLAGQRNTE
jgi:hypothetical protein